MSNDTKVALADQLGVANAQYSSINHFPAEIHPLLVDSMQQMAILAQAIQGPRARGSSRKAAALHEAGHAIVGRATAGGGFPQPYKVRVYEECCLEPEVGEVWLGCTENPPGTPDMQLQPGDIPRMHVYALRILAGIVAEQLFDPDDYRLGSSLDELLAGQIAAVKIAGEIGAEQHKVFYALFQLTGDVLRKNSRQVLRIAGWLQKHPKLGGSRLSEMLRGVELPAELIGLGLGGGK